MKKEKQKSIGDMALDIKAFLIICVLFYIHIFAFYKLFFLGGDIGCGGKSYIVYIAIIVWDLYLAFDFIKFCKNN